jgi:hypothetical protein
MICGRCGTNMTPIVLGEKCYCSSCGSTISNDTDKTYSRLPFDPSAQINTPNNSKVISSEKIPDGAKLEKVSIEDKPNIVNTAPKDILTDDSAAELLKNTTTIADLQGSTIVRRRDNGYSPTIEGAETTLSDNITDNNLEEPKITEISQVPISINADTKSDISTKSINKPLENSEILPVREPNQTENTNSEENPIQNTKNAIEKTLSPKEKNTTEIVGNNEDFTFNDTDNTKEINQKNTSKEEPDEFKELLANLTAEIAKTNNWKAQNQADETDKTPITTSLEKLYNNNDNNPAISGYKLNETDRKTYNENLTTEKKQDSRKNKILLDILNSDDTGMEDKEISESVDKLFGATNTNLVAKKAPVDKSHSKKSNTHENLSPKKIIAINDIINPITHLELSTGTIQKNTPASKLKETLQNTNTSEATIPTPISDKEINGHTRLTPQSNLNDRANEFLRSYAKQEKESNAEREFVSKPQEPEVEQKNEKHLASSLKEYFHTLVNNKPAKTTNSPVVANSNEIQTLKKLKIICLILFSTSILAITVSILVINNEKSELELITSKTNSNISVESTSKITQTSKFFN